MLADRHWESKEEEDEHLPPVASTKKKSAWGDDDKEQFDIADLSKPIDDEDRKAHELEMEKEQKKKDKLAEKELKKLRKELKKDKKEKKEMKGKDRSDAGKDDEAQWVEKPAVEASAKPVGATEKHDDWMATSEAGFDALIGQGQKREKNHERDEKKKAAQLEIDTKRYANELNPFLTGKATPETYQKVEVKTVGDGGASWRARLQKRQENVSKKPEEKPVAQSIAVPSKYQVSGDIKMQRPGERPTGNDRREVMEVDRRAEKEEVIAKKKEDEASREVTIESAQKGEFADLDANHITALALKARLMGDKEMYQRVLQALSERQVVVVVPTTDPRIAAMEVAHNKAIEHRSANKLPQPDQTKRRRKEKGEHEDIDLATMVAREKAEGGREYVQSLTENIVRNVGLMDDSNEWGDSTLYDTKRKKKNEQSGDQIKQRAVAEQKKQASIADSCWFCYDNPKIEKVSNISQHLIVALGNHVYLAVPKRGTLLEGHCMLVPMQHTVSMTTAEEEIEIEMQMFKKSLIAMFAKQKKEPIFMETVPNLKRSRHTFVEVVPLPAAAVSIAQGYFKKAINEVEDEWSQNKKLIDLTGKGARKAIPKQLPYFSVEFGNRTGFGHVIEESRDFPNYFGREVIGGLLDLSPEVWRHPKDDSPEKQRERTKNYVLAFHDFDWTRQLD